ncbi:hypothetical protein G647_06211 [Cladophialophora carrionii CBS 160.54]|uniref:Uncharacterized protein n=1 Tax=Cladophialophora carrionii CBS 160.54 TaxID=1279043 RepID=V9D771_9EURO|nr:uncharacterized protein G647_06211 [Cladophialophora carrionii CBS 160.54]ETI22138.1 hypothetical protein G647_06211 [Cladophialophora carrionii CBS 160.54]
MMRRKTRDVRSIGSAPKRKPHSRENFCIACSS